MRKLAPNTVVFSDIGPDIRWTGNENGIAGDPNWKNAYSIQWNFGVQRELPQGFLLSVNYVGSGSRRTDIGGRYGTSLYPGPGRWQDRAP